MRRETGNKLDQAIRAERLRLAAKIGIGVLIVVLVAGFNVPLRFETLYGTAGEIGVYQTDIGEVRRVDVQLLSGETILASLSSETEYQQGHRVEVQVGYTLFGIDEYRILRFIDEPKQLAPDH